MTPVATRRTNLSAKELGQKNVARVASRANLREEARLESSFTLGRRRRKRREASAASNEYSFEEMMTSDRRAFDAAKCSFSAAYDSTASGMAVCGTTGYSWFFYGYTYLIMFSSPLLGRMDPNCLSQSASSSAAANLRLPLTVSHTQDIMNTVTSPASPVRPVRPSIDVQATMKVRRAQPASSLRAVV